MRWIDDVHRLFQFYSVWIFVAVFVAAVGEVLVAFYTPPDLTHAIVAAIISGVLAIAGIVLRGIKQGPSDGTKQ